MKMLLSAILFIVAILTINGCGLDTGDTTNNDYSGQEYSYSYVFSEGDRDYGDGTVLYCNDANCSVSNTDDNSDNSETDDNSDNSGDAVVGVYDVNYNQVECNAAGFFYCTVDDVCMNLPVDDASSSCTN